MGLKGKWSSLKFPSTYTAIDLTGAKLWQANLTGVVGGMDEIMARGMELPQLMAVLREL